jgi:phosphoglycerate dehydrogenase-like enzyme
MNFRFGKLCSLVLFIVALTISGIAQAQPAPAPAGPKETRFLVYFNEFSAYLSPRAKTTIADRFGRPLGVRSPRRHHHRPLMANIGAMVPGALVVTYDLSARSRAILAEELGDAAPAVYLRELGEGERAAALRNAAALLSYNTAVELAPAELPLIAGARLLQFTTAGIDWIPLKDLPPGLPIAANRGASAEPMAEHIVAMALAAAKRLFVEHENLRHGEFNQRGQNRMLQGGVCGILGFGAVGAATARLVRGFGMRVHAINRRGASDEPVDWIATPDRLCEMLAVADLLVVAAALTRTSEGIIGAPGLAVMKEDAILVNVARGEIVDETALYEHLKAHPHFTACIDAWWVEPVRHGRFAMAHPFLDLPNVIGSPHNSAGGGVWRDVSLRRAVANCRRALLGEPPLNLIGPDERMI